MGSERGGEGGYAVHRDWLCQCALGSVCGVRATGCQSHACTLGGVDAPILAVTTHQEVIIEIHFHFYKGE